MKLSGTEVLLVGHTFRGAQCLTDRLVWWGFRCHFVSGLREAWDLLSSKPVDLVLSNTHLSDGTGFRLLMVLHGLPVTAFLCLQVENSCFWLPAIDAGEECLGSPALRPREFAILLEEMFKSLNVAMIQSEIEMKLQNGIPTDRKLQKSKRGS
jgi:hypothetical protein